MTSPLPYRSALILSLCTTLLVWAVYTWPLPIEPHLLVGEANGNNDLSVFIWNGWHLEEQLTKGGDILYTDWMFYPEGAPLRMNTNSWLMSLFALPFESQALGINIYILLHLLVASWGIWRIGKHFGMAPYWLVFAGLIYNFFPAHTWHWAQGHYNLMSVGLLPWIVYGTLRAFDVKTRGIGIYLTSRKWFFITLALGILTALASMLSAVFIIYFLLFWYCIRRFSTPFMALPIQKRWLIGIGCILTVHVLIALFRGQFHLDDGEAFFWGGDLFAYLLPPVHLFLYPDLSFSFPSKESTLFLGYSFLLVFILLLFITKKKREYRIWLLLSLLFLLYTIPSLRVGGEDFGLNGPTSILHYIPGLNQNRIPPRMEQLLVLFSGLAMAAMASQLSRRKSALLLVFLIGVSIVEWWPQQLPFANTQEVPTAYQALAAAPGEAVLTFPLGFQDGKKLTGIVNANDIHYQPIHRKKLISGYLARVPEHALTAAKSSPVLSCVLDITTGKSLKPFSREEWERFKQTYRVRSILLSPHFSENAESLKFLSEIKWDIRKQQAMDGYLLVYLK